MIETRHQQIHIQITVCTPIPTKKIFRDDCPEDTIRGERKNKEQEQACRA